MDVLLAGSDGPFSFGRCREAGDVPDLHALSDHVVTALLRSPNPWYEGKVAAIRRWIDADRLNSVEGYGLCNFLTGDTGVYDFSTSKWNLLERPSGGLDAGTYEWSFFVVVGSLSDCTAAMNELYARGDSASPWAGGA